MGEESAEHNETKLVTTNSGYSPIKQHEEENNVVLANNGVDSSHHKSSKSGKYHILLF